MRGRSFRASRRRSGRRHSVRHPSRISAYGSAINSAWRTRPMLPTHGRYDYSNITKRPDYTWPGGRRLAVYVALNIEAFGFGVGKGAAIAPPDQAQSHSVYS